MSIEPPDGSNVDGFNFDPPHFDKIAFARRACDTEPCIRGESWEYYNFSVHPATVTENILIALD